MDELKVGVDGLPDCMDELKVVVDRLHDCVDGLKVIVDGLHDCVDYPINVKTTPNWVWFSSFQT